MHETERKLSIVDPVIRWLVYGFIALLPLVFLGSAIYPIQTPKALLFYAITEIILVLWLARFCIRGVRNLRIPYSGILFAVFVLGLVISTIVGVNQVNSFWSTFARGGGILMWLHMAALLFVLMSVMRAGDWKKLFSASAIGGILSALLVYFGDIGFQSVDALKFVGSTTASTLGNNSFAGSYMVFVVFLIVYLLTQYRSRLIRWLCALGLVIVLLNPVLLNINVLTGALPLGEALRDPVKLLGQARAASMSIYFGFGLLLVMYIAFRVRSLVVRWAGRIVLILIGIAVVIGVGFALTPGNAVSDAMAKIGGKSRIAFWQMSVDGFKERPVFGWGPQNYYAAYQKHFEPRYALPEFNQEFWVDKAHNVIGEYMIAGGAVGVVLYFAVLVYTASVFWRAYRRRKKAGNSKVGYSEASIMTTLLVAYTLQNLTVFDVTLTYVMSFLIVGYAMWIEYQDGHGITILSRKQPVRLPSPYVRFGVLGVSIVGLSLALVFFVGKPLAKATTLNYLITEAPISVRANNWQRAFAISPMGAANAVQFIGKSELQVHRQNRNLASKKPNIVIKDLISLHNAVLDSLTYDPNNLRTYLVLGNIANMVAVNNTRNRGNRWIQQTERYANEAISIASGHQQAYWLLMQTKYVQEKKEKALEIAREVVDMEPRLKMAHQQALRIAELSNEKENMKAVQNRLKKELPNYYEQMKNDGKLPLQKQENE